MHGTHKEEEKKPVITEFTEASGEGLVSIEDFLHRWDMMSKKVRSK
jgi:hypothetical protein